MRTRSFPLVLLSSSQILWLQEALPRSPCPGMGLTSPERLEAWTEIVGSCPACFWGGPVPGSSYSSIHWIFQPQYLINVLWDLSQS